MAAMQGGGRGFRAGRGAERVRIVQHSLRFYLRSESTEIPTSSVDLGR